jgi:hypothetical protein
VPWVEKQSYVVGSMDESYMMVVIPTDLRCALTAPSISCMLSLTYILLVNIAFNINCAVSLTCKRYDDIMLIDRQSTQFAL